MKRILTINSLSEIDSVAEKFIKMTEGSVIIAFYAPMGAGKTTFTNAICRCLGVDRDAVSSPTFSIVNEYRTAKGSSVYHFDFYRINRLSEAFDIGFFDYLDSGELCIIEWPENIEDILPEDTLKVHISVDDKTGIRTIEWYG